MILNSRMRALLPWVAGTFFLGLVFLRVPLEEMARTTRIARLEWFLPVVACACVVWFLIDAHALRCLFTRFNTSLTGGEARELRGLTYLLTPIHWNLGRAAVIARMHRSHDVPLLEATSSMALYQTLDGILLSGLCLIGLSQLAMTPPLRTLQILVALFATTLVAYLFLVRSSVYDRGWIARIRASKLHRSHRLATRADIATLLGYRFAYYVVFAAVYVVGTAAFGLDLPLALLIASVPIIQGIGALPISPAGLGTQQAAMLYFFTGHGPDAAIVAFGLALPVLCIVLRTLIGWPYLGRLTRARASSLPAPNAVR